MSPFAVASDMSALQAVMKKSWARNPKVRAEYVKKFDYIESPKIDGYRSIHLVYKYRSRSEMHKSWNGLRIEIQIRSRLQHAWATAVETVDAFTGQGLKVSGGTGSEKKDWGRFFALMSSAIALREKTPVVPDTPINRTQLLLELKTIADRLRVHSTLSGWSYYMQYNSKEQAAAGDEIFLLTLNTHAYSFTSLGFKKSETKAAQLAYLENEKEIQSTPGMLTVLVSADSMDGVREAYPDYYADTSMFLTALERALEDIKGVQQAPHTEGESAEKSQQRDEKETDAKGGRTEVQSD